MISSSPKPTIILIGGSGLIGQALAEYFTHQHYRVIIVSRDPNRAREKLGNAYEYIAALHHLYDSISPDIVINLAGESVGEGKWTTARKAKLLESRLKPTQQLAEWLHSSKQRPKLIIQASAVGFYGNGIAHQRQTLAESAPAGSGFAAELCAQWETAAEHIQRESGIPVAICRLGVVLSEKGGILPTLIKPIKQCVGKIGTGEQPLNWIHRADVVAAIDHIIAQTNPAPLRRYNLVAPKATSQLDFAKSAARILRRPLIFSIPAPIMRLMLGEQADLVLEGEYIYPQALLDEQFVFRFANIDAALVDLLIANP